MASTDPLQLLLVGAGRMGRVHLRVARTTPAVTPVAIVDPVLAASASPDIADIDVFADLDEAIARGGFDAALIAAPSGIHRSLVEQAVLEGIPVLCEKPLGLTVADAAATAELIDRTGVTLQVGYWRRFVPELVQLRDRIASGEFGDVALVEAWQWDREPPSAEFRRGSGGIVRDMGVHEIDQIRWLTGEDIRVRSVVASSVESTDPVEGDPESIAMLASLSGGGIGYMSLGRRHIDGDACWVNVVGTANAERVDFMYGPDAEAVFESALQAQLEAFADTVCGRRPQAGATAADAVAALAVLEAVDQISQERTES